MVNLGYCSTDLLCFDTRLLYIIILIFNHQKLSVFFSGDIYLSSGISVSDHIFSILFLAVPKLFWDNFLRLF